MDIKCQVNTLLILFNSLFIRSAESNCELKTIGVYELGLKRLVYPRCLLPRMEPVETATRDRLILSPFHSVTYLQCALTPTNLYKLGSDDGKG